MSQLNEKSILGDKSEVIKAGSHLTSQYDDLRGDQVNMCILFVHTNPNPERGDYRLIVATNRDEHYERPAADAFWCDEGLLGEIWNPPGKGACGAVSPKNQRGENGEKKCCVGVLLNLTGDRVEHGGPRGGIVKDYLKTPQDFWQYTKILDKTKYSGYNVVGIELSKHEANVFHHSNMPKISSVYSGSQTLGFGNSPIYSPLTKVRDGRLRFEEIVEQCLEPDDLVEELLKLLKDKTSHLPDPELEKRSPLGYTVLSSIFVKAESLKYGTRTHTVILVDHEWQLHYIEHTLEQPIDIENPKWNVKHFQSSL
ncbi:hypothetical protein NQ318_005850 [Aromia moschata]|uniref:Uncharacterized protein n=1 Tax=Aromia moschata TaxID=1265417 RepID=A0AAV8YS79_9CUCU|nr:hypothetical protein NQ318_005850 [Aromia moschata]